MVPKSKIAGEKKRFTLIQKIKEFLTFAECEETISFTRSAYWSVLASWNNMSIFCFIDYRDL
jgi:hypothetical protein